MAIHRLKTLPEYYGAAISGEKTFELRKDDRGFRVGDVLRLMEWEDDRYTGREMSWRIKYILRGPVYGLAEGWCILALGPTR